MATRKFLYFDNIEYQTESVGAFETSDFVSVSSGAGNAGDPIVLDAGGKIGASLLDFGVIDHDQLLNFLASEHFTVASIDHGLIAGLGDDDHTQYSLADGSRDYTSIVSYDATKTFTSGEQIPDKNYVDTAIAAAGTSAEWQDSCLSILLTPPGSPTTGDRHLINGVGTGAWAGQDYDIAEWNGTSWDFTTPTTGTYVSVDAVSDGIYYFGGTGPWVKKEFESTTASLGCKKVGSDIQADLQASGGLKLNSNSLLVEPNDFAGEGLVDDGADNLAFDWSTAFNDSKAVKASDLASVANGLGASIIGVEDSAGYYSTANIESVLAEIGLTLASGLGGVDYTVGTGGVSKGDLLYVSANDTVLPKSTLTSADWGIGLAETTEAAAASVKSVANDTVITGILTGSTAGTRYYWDGTGHTATIPSGSGVYVWQTGVAKNATDLQTEINFIRRNA